MEAQRNTERIIGLDSLRTISICLVILNHLHIGLASGLGVTLFYTISGFIITKLLILEKSTTANFAFIKFFYRRCLKLIPPLTVIIILPSIIFKNLFNIENSTIFSQIFFYFNWKLISSASVAGIPGGYVVWSLSVEEQYYILVAITWIILIKFRIEKSNGYLLAIYVLIYLVSTFERIYISNSGHFSRNQWGDISRISFGTDTRIGAIAMGGIIAIIFTKKKTVLFILNKKFVIHSVLNLFICCIIVSLLIISQKIPSKLFIDSFRFNCLELVSFLTVLLTIINNDSNSFLQKIIKIRIMNLIGKSSYCIYLSHLVIINFANNFAIFNNLGSRLFLFTITILIGIALYFCLDAPFEKFRNNLRSF